MTINSIQITGDFEIAGGTCAGSLAQGQSCTIQVTFTPSGAAQETGTLTITDDASNSPQVVDLTGKGE